MKCLLLILIVLGGFVLPGCSDNGATVVQPDPETRTNPQWVPQESMDDVQ